MSVAVFLFQRLVLATMVVGGVLHIKFLAVTFHCKLTIAS